MTYPPSGSILNSQINSGLSTQITVKVGGVTIGAIQQLVVNQNRDMHRWEEIGTDGVVEMHPKGAARIELQVTRIVFDDMRLPEAFARGFINLQAQRIPFDIQLVDKTSANISTNAIVHIFNNCWFKAYSPTFRADNFIVSETATIQSEYVITNRNATSAVHGGIRGVGYERDSVERSTDVNGHRGRLEPTSAGNAIGGNLAGS
jgi:hypothetical protein